MGFLAPWFLCGLATLGVPVFVHLLRRHVTTPRPVSSLMFFDRGIAELHASPSTAVSAPLRDAICAGVAVGAGICQSICPAARDGCERSLLLIVLDHSFSMRAGSRFADAKRRRLQCWLEASLAPMAQVMALGGQLAVLTQPISGRAQLRLRWKAFSLAIDVRISAIWGRGFEHWPRVPNARRSPPFQRYAEESHAGQLRRPGAACECLCLRFTRWRTGCQPQLDGRKRERPGAAFRSERSEEFAGTGDDGRLRNPAATQICPLVVNGKTMATRR